MADIIPGKSNLKVAIVHDWLYGGGAERLVYELHKLFPDAPIYTSYCSKEWRQKLDGKVVTGFLQHWPFPALRKYIPFLRIWWFTHLVLNDYDLVVSSSGAEAKGINVPTGTVHINYCHAPTHYYWSRYEEYLQMPGFGVFDPLARLGLKLLVDPLRRWDFKAAQRPNFMIANSTHIQQQIKQYYQRDSEVIFPPVDCSRFTASSAPQRLAFVIAGRQIPYKRFDIAITACTRLNLPLTVIGDGPDNARLKKLAGPSVTFVGRVSDEEVARYFANAKALIFPGLDDFGITPVEALAAGTPVIAYMGGGALDYIDGATGRLFAHQTPESLMEILGTFDVRAFDTQALRNRAALFSTERFRQAITQYINEHLGGNQ